MPRAKEFDPAVVLERAMEVFWRQGYESTSVQDLVGAMGINRGSLYDTFGDKRRLFLAAIERYCDATVQGTLDMLAEAGSARDAVARFVDHAIESSCGRGRRNGCLLTNAAVELCQDCDDTATLVQGALDRITGALADAIRVGQESGELTTREDPQALARFFLCHLQGTVVLAKANHSKAKLRELNRVALSVLEASG
jgi:TetR/AcrR family transcriptional regulator, transcriptional repressor for nem operon